MTNTPISISDKQRQLEIVRVVATGLGKFVFMDWLGWKLPFISIAIITWLIYVLIRHRQVPEVLKYWGFRIDNFTKVIRMVLPFGIIAIVIFSIVGYYSNTINLSWHIIPILVLYPIWGTIQQFLVIGLVAGNVKGLKKNKLPDVAIILLTALLFGLLHYPFYWLMAGTFVLALFYGYVYLKARNVYVMGIFHGWLGALFFYTVVGRDPFEEVLRKFLQ